MTIDGLTLKRYSERITPALGGGYAVIAEVVREEYDWSDGLVVFGVYRDKATAQDLVRKIGQLGKGNFNSAALVA